MTKTKQSQDGRNEFGRNGSSLCTGKSYRVYKVGNLQRHVCICFCSICFTIGMRVTIATELDLVANYFISRLRLKLLSVNIKSLIQALTGGPNSALT